MERALVPAGGHRRRGRRGRPTTLARAVQEQARHALSESDVAVLVVDARAGPAPGRRRAGAELQPLAVPVVVAANKVDGPAALPDAAEFHALGLGDPVPVSAQHGLGTGDLLDRVTEHLQPRFRSATRTRRLRLAVIGRPNVGKSSLVNRFLGEERVIVSERAGTTRDAIDTRLEVDGRELVLVDTAGLRRRSEGGRHRRLLRAAALRAGGRARRRGARGLRRRRGRDEPGPERRRAGDEEGLRHDRGPEQVGRGPRPTSRTRARAWSPRCACGRR